MTTPFPFVAGTVLTAAKLNAITSLPINDQTASYVAVVGDVGKRVVMNVATANTVTVNDTIFTAGDTIFVANKGAGASTITAGAGVTINSASGLALVTSQSGQLVALSASSFIFFASETRGKIVQVVTGSTSTAVVSSTDTFVDTLLTATITPTSASNSILVVVTQNGCSKSAANNGNRLKIRLVRGATSIQTIATDLLFTNSALANFGSTASQFLDAPATTSATTYKTQFANTANTASVQVQTDGLAESFITLYEVTP